VNLELSRLVYPSEQLMGLISSLTGPATKWKVRKDMSLQQLKAFLKASLSKGYINKGSARVTIKILSWSILTKSGLAKQAPSREISIWFLSTGNDQS
jgi:hypothetical protein